MTYRPGRRRRRPRRGLHRSLAGRALPRDDLLDVAYRTVDSPVGAAAAGAHAGRAWSGWRSASRTTTPC